MIEKPGNRDLPLLLISATERNAFNQIAPRSRPRSNVFYAVVSAYGKCSRDRVFSHHLDVLELLTLQ